MKKYLFGLVALVMAVATVAFTVPVKKVAANYWVYTSSTNSGFRDATKYVQQFLLNPDQPGCANTQQRPCVYKEAIGSISTSAGLQTELNSLANDAAVLSASLRTKSVQ